MQLDCPKCNTSFSVDLIHIGTGRQVECSVCKNKWIAKTSDLMEIEQTPLQNEIETKKIPDSNFGKAKYILFFMVLLIGIIGFIFLEQDQLINSHTFWIKFFQVLNF